jgi:hypothetical protein
MLRTAVKRCARNAAKEASSAARKQYFSPGTKRTMLDIFFIWAAASIASVFVGARRDYPAWNEQRMHNAEPAVVGLMAAKGSRPRLEEVKAEGRDPSLSPFRDEDVAELKRHMAKEPIMTFVFGPKHFGKTSIAGLPERLGISEDKTIFVEYEFKEGDRLQDFLYNWFHFHATYHYYPSREAGELRSMYLEKVFEAIGGKDAALVLDLRQATEQDWEQGFAVDVLNVRRLGINVLVTTSEEGMDAVQKSVGCRRSVFLFGEGDRGALPLGRAGSVPSGAKRHTTTSRVFED